MNGKSYYDVLEPWMVKPFELILHGEIHRLSGTDYDKRLALISFDNSIEVSISSYLCLPSSLKKYPKEFINTWLRNFQRKLLFIEEYLRREKNYQEGDVKKLKEELQWLHTERNKQYHESSSSIPDENTLEKMREKAIWAFSTLFEIQVSDVENLVKSELVQFQAVQNLIETQKRSFHFPSELELSEAQKEFAFLRAKASLRNYEKSLFFAVIFGEWNERYNGDVEVIREIVSRSMNFEEWMSDLREIMKYSSDIIVFKNGQWKVNSKNEILSMYLSSFYDQHLIDIKSVSIKVLSEKDPTLELTLEDKISSFMSGVVPKFSSGLKQGLCETIAFIGVNSSNLKYCSSDVRRSITGSILREILKSDDWRIWANLNGLLPVLAEADPDEFLSIVKDILLKPSGAFAVFFGQDKEKFEMSELFMFGLYQALEVLAWSEEYLQSSLIALAGLAHLYPKGKENYPLNSITGILFPWLPQTTAPLESKVLIVRAMARYYPDITFKVLIQLLQGIRQFKYEHRKPMFRNYIPVNWKEEPTREECIREVEEYASIAVNVAKGNPEYLKELIQKITNIPPKAFDNLVTYLSSSSEFVTDEEKEPIWMALFYAVARNKRFSNAKWALPPEKVLLLEQLESKFAPSDPKLLYGYLFSSESFEYIYGSFDAEKENEILENRKIEALKEIYKTGNTESIIEFAMSVEKPAEVGFFFARISNAEDDRKLLPSYLGVDYAPEQQFIGGYIEGCYFSKGFQWLYSLNIIDWSIDERLSLFLKLPFENEVWNNLEKFLGERSEDYWRKVAANPYRTESDLFIAVRNLLKYDRPLLAFLCIYVHYIRKKELLKEEAIDALQRMDMLQEKNYFVSEYQIVEIIKILYSDKEMDEKTLFEIEWKYLPLLNEYYDAKPELLERRLSTDPDFFIKVVRLVYRPKDQTEEEHGYSEERVDDSKSRALWNLLNTWKIVPGITDDGSFNVGTFKEWLEKVSNEARESGHSEVAMLYVGRVLLYTPPDSSGLWINLDVAEILDKPENEQIRRGYVLEILDSEGVREYDPSGKYERERAEFWRNRAKELKEHGLLLFAEALEDAARRYELEGNMDDL